MSMSLDEERIKSNKDITMILYVLYGVSIFNGVTALIAIVINYLKKDEVVGTFLESHFTWQIRTFWLGLIWSIIGFVNLFWGAGLIILMINGAWFIYRIFRGVNALLNNKKIKSNGNDFWFLIFGVVFIFLIFALFQTYKTVKVFS